MFAESNIWPAHWLVDNCQPILIFRWNYPCPVEKTSHNARYRHEDEPYASKPPTTPEARRPRGLTRHKRRETARLVRSVLDAGLSVRGVEVDAVTGALRVLTEPGKGTEFGP